MVLARQVSQVAIRIECHVLYAVASEKLGQKGVRVVTEIFAVRPDNLEQKLHFTLRRRFDDEFAISGEEEERPRRARVEFLVGCIAERFNIPACM